MTVKHRIIQIIGTGVVLIAVLIGAVLWTQPHTPQVPEPVNAVVDQTPLAAAMSLNVIVGNPAPPYRRDEFGESWPDLDRDGCNERQEVLHRDLTEVVVDDEGCTVLSGTLQDPYTGRSLQFEHDRIGGDSQAVQIDHIVALSAAWEGGAYTWTPERRVQFANDANVLLAVDGPTNAGKGDAGPSEWLPENPDFRCTYASAYAQIAADYDIAVSSPDKDALVTILTICGR